MRTLAGLAIVALLVGQREPESAIYLRVNQVGYATADSKIAVAFGHVPPGPLEIVDAANARVVLRMPPRVVPGAWGEFAHHAEFDFSTITRAGRYALRIVNASERTIVIRDSPYSGLPDRLLEFMRHQRCGDNPSFDAVCHRHDRRTAYGPIPSGTHIDVLVGRVLSGFDRALHEALPFFGQVLAGKRTRPCGRLRAVRTENHWPGR